MGRGDNQKFVAYLTDDETIEADKLRDYLWNNKIYPDGKNNSRYALVKYAVRFLLTNKDIFYNYDLFEKVSQILLKDNIIKDPSETLTYLIKWAFYHLTQFDNTDIPPQEHLTENVEETTP